MSESLEDPVPLELVSDYERATGRTWSERMLATKLLRDFEEIIDSDRKASELTDHFLVAGLVMHKTLLRTQCLDPFTLQEIVRNLMAEYAYIERGDLFEQLGDRQVIRESYLLHLIGQTLKSIKARRLGSKGWEFD